ncbi:MAG: sulfotransferase [Flavobacteriales bacterium]|nr:sulfotransferase [Flavobacteriales bacterium]
MEFSRQPFLFVGAAKAGTTSIYHYLKQHPELHIPKKETFYFLRDIYTDNALEYPYQRSPEDVILDSASYERLYENTGGKVTGEVGTGYLYHHEQSIPRIKEVFGEEVNILIILRDPVERAYSSYNHFVKDMHEPLTFRQALEEESSRAQQGWDFMWHHRALGCYAQQVRAFLQAFDKVKVLRYDDLKNAPAETMREIFRFIGVDPSLEVTTEKQFNPSGTPRSAFLQKLLIHDNPLKRLIRPLVRSLMSKERRENIRKELKSMNLRDYEQMDPELRTELRSYYAQDIRELEALTGLDLSDWK